MSYQVMHRLCLVILILLTNGVPVIAQAQDRTTALKYFFEAERLAARGTVAAQREAIERYEAALAIFRQLQDRFFEVGTLNSIGITLFALGEWHRGAEYFEQALPLARAAGNRAGETMILFNLAYYHDATGERQRALDMYEQVLPLLRAMRNRRDEASTLNNIGLIYDALGEKDRALEYFTQSLRLEREIGISGSERAVLSNLASLALSLGDRQQALDYYRQALALSQTAADRRTEVRVLNNLAGVLRSLGDDRQAGELSQRALELSRAAGDKDGEAQSLHALAFIHDMNRADDEALKLYEQALELRRALGDRSGEAGTLGNIAVILTRRGDRQRALELHQQAMELYRATSDKAGQGSTLIGIGTVYAEQGEPQRALEYFRAAGEIYRSLRDVSAEAAVLYRVALAYDALGQLTEARAAMLEVIDFIEAQRAGLVSQELRTSWLSTKQRYYDYLVDLLMRRHEQDAEGGFAAAALEVSEQARARSLLELLAESRADIRAGADPELLGRERQLRQRLNAKAAAQTRLLNGIHTTSQAAALEKEIAALGAQLEEIETRLRRTSPRYAALTQPRPLSLAEIQRQVLDDETLLLEYALGETRSYLWVVSSSAVSSFVLPPRAEIDALARSVYEDLSVRPAKSGAPQLQSKAAALSHMLLGPASAQLGSKRLLIVAPGMLSFLPFAALPAPEVGSRKSEAGSRKPEVGSKPTSGRRRERRAAESNDLSTADGRRPTTGHRLLIEDHEIIHLPSASVLSVIRNEQARRQEAAKTVAVLADPVFETSDPRLARAASAVAAGGQPAAAQPAPEVAALSRAISSLKGSTARTGLARLPFSREEADAISSFAAAGDAMQATDFRASRAMALSDELGRYRIIHFATHGLLNGERPELSGLVLSLFDESGNAQDGFLRLHEIYNLKLSADLVVLSACQTGIGREVRGEGLIALTRGFMYAGAPRVVASLWQVDDLATAGLMKTFYQRMLKERLRPAAALRAAQLEMIRGKRRAAPYFWAAFTIQGEWK